MLTRLSTPSPFPQTPARQTAPAAQRPAAQRQGFSGAELGSSEKLLALCLSDLDNLALKTQAEKEALLNKIQVEIDKNDIIGKHLTILLLGLNDTPASFSNIKKVIKGWLSIENRGLREIFEVFEEELNRNTRKSILIEGRAVRARKLSTDFLKIYKQVNAMPVNS